MTATGGKFVQMPVGVIDDRSLSDRAFRLLAKIQTFAWESSGSVCTASQGRLARELGWSADKVQRALTQLVDLGYLTAGSDRRKHPGKPHTYTLTYRNSAASTYRNSAATDTAELRQLDTAVQRHEVDEEQADEEKQRTARTSSRKTTARKPTTRQLALLCKLSEERGLDPQTVATAEQASQAIDALLALPKPGRPAHNSEPEPTPTWRSVSYSGDRIQVEMEPEAAAAA